MKPIILLFLWCLFFPVQAQDVVPESQSSIVAVLQSNDSQNSKGVIRITADPGINSLIGTPWNSFAKDMEYIKVQGFRVQAFSGNDSRISKDEAYRKEQVIKEAFPGEKTYIDYRPPRWSLRVGDFRTKEEAIVFLQELKKTFPEFGREMYVVKVDEVNIPVNNQD
ncbi:MAG: SPOR domain-containing protein [Dysgonamonadaceae bacterium]|jgi:hypothetical protein|nr:SPOR domain-containing protein [Dysgonamonadaceae bacterium]